MELGELDQPRPLQGRLGLCELLFTRRSAPITAYFSVTLLEKILVGATAALLLLLFAISLRLVSREIDRQDLMNILGVLLAFSIALSELLIIPFGFLFTTRHLGLWKRQHRIAEIYLTALRPVEFGQCVIAAPVKSFVLFLTLTFAGFTLLMFYYHYAHAGILFYFLFLFALTALNSVLNLYAFSWIALPYCLIYGGLRSAIFYSVTVFMYLLALLPPLALAIGLLNFLAHRVRNNQFREMLLVLVVYLVIVLLSWIIKLLFARAYAARLEQAVYPRLTF